MPSENTLHCQEREVREVLVVDRIELILLNEAQQMRELDGDDAAGLSRIENPSTKSLRSGTCAMTLFAAIISGTTPKL